MSNSGEHHMNIGDTVFLRPTAGASQRTKNRIREHGGDGFVVCNVSTACWPLNSRPAVLLEPTLAEDNWLGWLPLDEIEEVQE